MEKVMSSVEQVATYCWAERCRHFLFTTVDPGDYYTPPFAEPDCKKDETLEYPLSLHFGDEQPEGRICPHFEAKEV